MTTLSNVAFDKNRDFTNAVELASQGKGPYPTQVTVPLDEPFVNPAGRIQNLVLERFTSVAVIQSERGSIRANHWHRTDWHYTYVLKGKVEYFWSFVKRTNGAVRYSQKPPNAVSMRAGQMFFTPPEVLHAMFFPVETTIVTFANNVRDHDSHEQDVVRSALITVRGGLVPRSAMLEYQVYWARPNGQNDLILETTEPMTYV